MKKMLKIRYRFAQKKANVHKLYIYDDVRAKGDFNWKTWNYEESETSAKYFRDQLEEIPDGDTIELHVNSAGGEVGEGVTIYNLLRQKSKTGSKIIGYVDGTAYSVAMNIVMACDEIHMGLGTSMFLHNPWTVAVGNAEALRNVAEQLDVLSAASRQLYLSRAKNLTEEDLAAMMDKETMLDPVTCFDLGFCDFVGEKKEDEEEPEEVTEEETAEEPEETQDETEETEEPSDEDPEKEESEEEDETEEEDPDEEDEEVKQLKQHLFIQKQINATLVNLQGNKMRNTLAEALNKFGGN